VYQIKRLSGLLDVRAKARILARLDSARLGNLGNVASVGDGVSEIRVDVAAGYRVYFTRRQWVVVILLCGGDKSTKTKDIVRAKLIAKAIE
jgi:putative addiction module killer protein